MMNLSTNKIFSKMRYILLISLIIETLLSVSVLAYINNSLSGMDSNATVTVPSQASDISFSYDHRYIQYVQDGKLKILDMDTNKLYKEIDEKGTIVYSYFLNDRNIITYFVKSDKSSSKTNSVSVKTDKSVSKTVQTKNEHNNMSLLVKSFNLDSKVISDYGSLSVNDFQKIDQVVYSSLTNVVYINISLNNNSHNVIYKMNVMKQKEIYESGKTIENMVLLQNTDKLLYEDDQGNVYMDRKRLNIKGYSSLQLLGSDADNNIYLMTYDGNEILKVNDQKIIGTTFFGEGQPNFIINNPSGVFLVYDDYAVDVSVNPKRKIVFEKGSKPLYLFDHNVYTLNDKNEINVENNMF